MVTHLCLLRQWKSLTEAPFRAAIKAIQLRSMANLSGTFWAVQEIMPIDFTSLKISIENLFWGVGIRTSSKGRRLLRDYRSSGAC